MNADHRDMNRACIIDPARFARLWDVGAEGRSACVVVDADGTESLWILDQSAGAELPANDVPRHERRNGLPNDIRAAVWGVYLCWASTTRAGACRNRVAARGMRCHHHREDTA
jgi:hypothetical protein